MMRWMKRNEVFCDTADIVGKTDLRLNIQETGLPDKHIGAQTVDHLG